MVLQNFIRLEEGKPTTMHFDDHEIQQRAIRDPLTGRAKLTNVLVFRVDELDGVATSSEYSITAERHAMDFAPFLEDKSYVNFLWTITPRGAGFQREYEVDRQPIRG